MTATLNTIMDVTPWRYHHLDQTSRDRLLARGISPERSTAAFLDAVRRDLPLDRLLTNLGRSPIAPGLPLAMVFTDEQHAAYLEARKRNQHRKTD